MNIPIERLTLIDEEIATKIQAQRTQLNEFPEANKLEPGVVLVKASEMKPRPINWIWDGWLASGKIHLIGGIAGTGKTTISLAIASCITNGEKLPDGTIPETGEIVMWTGEDDPEDTLTPRLMAMNADLNKVHFVRGYSDGNKERPFNPSTNMVQLEEKLKSLKNIKLLIIDPIVAVVANDSHNNGDVRQSFAPLIQMAEKLKFAVLGITHLTKSTSGKEPIERITGSLAFGALARVVLFTSKCKNSEGDDIRIFLRAKSNIGSDQGGFEYELESSTTQDGIATSKVVWGDVIEGSARELLNRAENDFEGGGLKECMKWLTELLATGSIRSNEAEKEAINAGFSIATFRRAKEKLKVKSTKIGVGKLSFWEIDMPKALNRT